MLMVEALALDGKYTDVHMYVVHTMYSRVVLKQLEKSISENSKTFNTQRQNLGNFKHFMRHESFCDMPVRGCGCKKCWSSGPWAENVSVNRDPLLACDKKIHDAKSA